FAPEGTVTAKHERLHQELYGLGLARPFNGRFDDWTHPPLNTAPEIATALERIISQSRPQVSRSVN
ncbi:MAG: ELM1/GtrOC1 family putative glycosyltransferase, partial [Rhodospirillaceae bacterium]